MFKNPITTKSADPNLIADDKFRTPADMLKALEEAVETFKTFAETGVPGLATAAKVTFDRAAQRLRFLEEQAGGAGDRTALEDSKCGLCEKPAERSGFTFLMDAGLCKECYDDLSTAAQFEGENAA